MGLTDWLKKSELLVFWNRCRIYRKDPEFRKWVIKDYFDPQWVKIYRQGNEHEGQTIYNIDEYGLNVGFFSEVIFTLFRLYYADSRGFTPYVYWGKEHLYYEPGGIKGQYNVFLYYFQKVSEIAEVKHAAHVIDSAYEHIHEIQDHLGTHGYDVSELYMKTLTLMVEKYIHYNEQTRLYLENEFEKLIGNKKALAVHFRGTDYRRQYNNHPVFVTIEQEILEVQKLIKKKGYEIVFLATDEEEAIRKFRREFGDRLKVYEDTWRAPAGDESVAYSHSNREHHHYLLGLEVLRDQYTLTRCSGLVCGISNLTIMARIMRNAWYEPYEDLMVINNGICVNDNAFMKAKH